MGTRKNDESRAHGATGSGRKWKQRNDRAFRNTDENEKSIGGEGSGGREKNAGADSDYEPLGPKTVVRSRNGVR